MKELYLEVFSNVSEDGMCFVPLETVIALFVYEYCKQPSMLITLLISSDLGSRSQFKIKLPNVLFEILDVDDIEPPGNLCKFPSIVMNEGTTCIGGLCSVLRQIVKVVNEKHPLLGFKQGCLNACAESSVWTKFCEVDIIETVNNVFKRKNWEDNAVHVPCDMARFEVHMGKPVKAHNIQKQKQDLIREIKKHSPNGEIDTAEQLQHLYSEGHKMSLADLVLFPCFHVCLQLIGSPYLRQCLPLTYKWYNTLISEKIIKKAIKFVLEINNGMENVANVEYITPQIANISLYKSDWRISRKKRENYTKQDVIDSNFEKLNGIHLTVCSRSFGCDMLFDWATVPFEIQLGGSEFPSKRLERKTQQLENMAKAVLKIAKTGDKIVDFCSGSGYLGLLLAHALPSCTVILLENKDQSLRRARETASSVKMANVVFCQGNIDYFRGDFDIGVSLHACGVATDLVMEKCLDKKASFVCCPCCYGSVQPNHMIKYPRSEAFKDSGITVEGYLTLAHASDQTHDGCNHKTSQGKKCMTIIDTDRCLRAKDRGYTVFLSIMEPSSCTPKNHILVGIPQRLCNVK